MHVIGIEIVPGKTDLSQFPREVLEALKEGLSAAHNELDGQVESIEKVQEQIGAEIRRVVDEIKRQTTPAEMLMKMVEEHIASYGDYGPSSRKNWPVETFTELGDHFVKIPLPDSNSGWTFTAWKWAESFCKKYDCYPVHYSHNSPKFIYLKSRAKNLNF
jgi:hypothetical protein